MIKVIRRNTIAVLLVMGMLLTAAVTPVSAAASTVTVPQGVTPVKSWTVVVGTTYKIPDDVKQAGDTYASSDTAIVTVNASTGQFAPQAAGVAYIMATNGSQSRYFKVTASAATTTANLGALNGYPVSVLNTTTSAVTVSYYAISGTFANYFSAADGTILGSISQDTYVTVLNSAVSSGVLDVNDSGSAWMAGQFNLYRGIGSSGSSSISDGTSANGTVAVEDEIYKAIELINEAREREELSPLSIDDTLMDYAAMRAIELEEKYSHERPDGSMARYAEVAGTKIVDSLPASKQVSSWLNSENHSTIILSSKYNKIGIGVYQKGSYLYWVANLSK